MKDNSRKSRALFIAYEFPPLGGIASVWVTKYVKYLPGFGWDPVVVTVKDAPTNIPDESLEDELPQGLDVRRSFSLEPTRLFRFIKRMSREEASRKRIQENSGNVIYSYTGLPFNVLKKIKVLMIPDEKIGWFPFALRIALQAVQEKKTRVILSTAPPYTAHLVAMACSRLTGLPWVCEFRDPWIDNPHYRPASLFNRRLVYRMEESMVRKADALICAMPGIVEGFRKRYGDAVAQKCHVITNGFDSDDFSGDVKLNEKFTMTWIGSVYGDLYPDALMKAVKLLLNQGRICKEDFRISFVGTMDVESYGSLKKSGLENLVEMIGFVDHKECIRRMRSSHLLLLQLAGGEMSRMLYTGKMFEYFGARRPILALVEEGATADLINELEVGRTARPGDIQKIFDDVLYYYELFKSNRSPEIGNSNLADLFNREMLTGKLAQILNSVSSGSRTP